MKQSDHIVTALQARARVNSRDGIARSGRLKAKKSPRPGFNLLFVGLMLCYLMWQLLIWVFQHLTVSA